MSKKSRFRGSFNNQHGKWDETLLKSEWQHFYHIHWSLWRQVTSKRSLLVISKILGIFFKTLTSCHKYSLLNSHNLTQPIQMQLSLRWKAFSEFLSKFLKWKQNLEPFQEKMTLIADVFWNYGLGKPWLDKKSRFWRPFEKQHGKLVRTLLKSEPQHL